jgi:ketosteroid isomerase-like protein
MSEENVEIVRRWIEAFNRGGVDMAAHFVDSDVEWTTTGLYIEAGTYRGHEGVLRYLDALAAEFEDFRSEPEELIDAGDQVVVPVRITGRGRQSGAPVDLAFTMVVSLRNGRIFRIRNFPEKAEALEAAGLGGSSAGQP